ncbi:carbohydrate-binding module family 13 protein [Irpex lacteus]|nr:carbohydrate-binding module family 13 protein [Irpex lacteus]
MAGLEPGAVYRFINAKAGNVLDLSGDDNRSCIGWEWHGGDNQRWRLEKVRDADAWVIVNVATGGYLSITQNLVDGIQVEVTSDPTQWSIQNDEEDPSLFRFFVLNTWFNLDLADHGNPNNGTPVTVWGKWEGRNQCWRLEPGKL